MITISEAIRTFLFTETKVQKKRDRAISLQGKLSPKEAALLKDRCRAIRQSWRF